MEVRMAQNETKMRENILLSLMQFKKIKAVIKPKRKHKSFFSWKVSANLYTVKQVHHFHEAFLCGVGCVCFEGARHV